MAQARRTVFRRAPSRYRLFILIVEMTLVLRVRRYHGQSDRCTFGPHWTLTSEVSSQSPIPSPNKYLPRVYTLCSEQPCCTTPEALFVWSIKWWFTTWGLNFLTWQPYKRQRQKWVRYKLFLSRISWSSRAVILEARKLPTMWQEWNTSIFRVDRCPESMQSHLWEL